MNLNEMITFVRTHADTDTDDAPTSSLTVYARAAFNDIKHRTYQWLDNTTMDTLTTVMHQAAYAFDGAEFANANLEYVSSVVGENGPLIHVAYTSYLELEDGYTGTGVCEIADDATHFSVRGPNLYLYPSPSGVQTYQVHGYREFVDWPASGAATEPDLPRVFDEAICWYMLSMYYRAQEDLELAQIYTNDYNRSVDQQIAAMMRNDSVVKYLGKAHGGGHRLNYASWMKRNTEG